MIASNVGPTLRDWSRLSPKMSKKSSRSKEGLQSKSGLQKFGFGQIGLNLGLDKSDFRTKTSRPNPIRVINRTL